MGKKCLRSSNREKWPFKDLWEEIVQNPTKFKMGDSFLLTFYFKDSSARNLHFWAKRHETEFQSGTALGNQVHCHWQGIFPGPALWWVLWGNEEIKRHCSSPPGASNLVGKANVWGPHVMRRIIVECQEQNKVKVRFCMAGRGCSNWKIR